MKTKTVTKVTLLTMLAISLLVALTLNSCQKEVVKPAKKTAKVVPTDPLNSSAKIMNDINNLVFAGVKSQKGIAPPIGAVDSSGCVTITIDTVDKPNTVTYNYGTGCVGGDGATRSGIVIVNYNTRDIRVVNNVYTITMQNYVIDTITVNGSYSITNTGTNTNGNLVLVEAGAYTLSHGSTSNNVNVNYNYEWIAGSGSSPLTNLQFSITGSCIESLSTGGYDSLIVTTPLIKNSKSTTNCNYIIQGTTYTSCPSYNFTTDYGNPGNCSGEMAVTLNGVVYIAQQTD